MIRRLIAALLRWKARHEATPRRVSFPIHAERGDAVLVDGGYVVAREARSFRNIEELRRYRDSLGEPHDH